LLKQSAYSAEKVEGAGTLQFLTEHFSFLGFEGQYWMLIVVGVIAIFISFARKNRNRI
jgi:H+/gluconate symporter-like permease